MEIAIIDDHTLLSGTLAGALEKSIPHSNTKLFKSTAAFFAEGFAAWKPDIILLDVMLPGSNGIEMIGKILLDLSYDCHIIMLSSITDAHSIKTAIDEGASGYLSKDTPIEELLIAIQAVQKGEKYIALNLRDGLLNYMMADNNAYLKLSNREKDVLEKICGGKTPKEIAAETNLSINTVQSYLKAVMRKFKVNRTADLILLAIQKGYYNPMKKG